jgi:hypothetical protein
MTKANNMKILQTLESTRIKVTEPSISEIYYIEQDDNNRFYVTSSRGYNGYEGEGHSTIEAALKAIKTSIKNYFLDRCLEAPENF